VALNGVATAAPTLIARASAAVGWKRLPREARDTLFMLFVIGWTVLPHIEHLPLWCSLLTLVVLLWRAKLALANATLPSRWALAGMLLTSAGLTLWSFQTLLGKEPGVTMVVVLMALKTLELRARRDAFVVFFLGFFIVLTHFLYSQTLLVALAMLVSVWGLLTALVLVHMPAGQPSLRQAGRLAARTALWGAPIMAMMFVLFPRVGPLWGVPKDGQAKTGLSSTLRMGTVAELAGDDTIALRIRFDGPPPPPAALYFRGPVLTRFNGIEWRASPYDDFSPIRMTELRTEGAPVRYEMTLEPLRSTTLPLLEATGTAPVLDGYRAQQLADLQWIADRPVIERLRFRAEAWPQFSHGPRNGANPGSGAGAATLREALELPRGYNPRTLAWAAALRQRPDLAGAGPRAFADALMQHIRTEHFSYTVAPGTYGRDAVDEFWLDRREGFCEHFASAFVVIMRALGVPARIVTGFQGTDPQPVDGFYAVRQSSAHAWAEYWEPASGWVRADPTAAVAPDRIFRGNRLAPAPGLIAGAFGEVSPELLASLRQNWEAVNNRWNQWVLSYSRGQQIDVLKSLGVQSPSWEDLALLLIGCLSTLALAGAVWAWWDRRRVDPWVRQMERLREVLRELGLDSAPFEAPRALAARVRERFGAAGEPLAALLDALERQRYSALTIARPDAALTRAFVTQGRALRAAR
jgi:transglutaminase-like putative cysteine protease